MLLQENSQDMFNMKLLTTFRVWRKYDIRKKLCYFLMPYESFYWICV